MIEKQPYESLPKVEVRDNDADEWRIAYLIRSYIDGSCLTMHPSSSICSWKQMRPYLEPTKRPMTHKEMFKATKGDALVRDKDDSEIIGFWSSSWVISGHEISYDWGDTWQECETEEVEE